jgi:hypothetical protein
MIVCGWQFSCAILPPARDCLQSSKLGSLRQCLTGKSVLWSCSCLYRTNFVRCVFHDEFHASTMDAVQKLIPVSECSVLGIYVPIIRACIKGSVDNLYSGTMTTRNVHIMAHIGGHLGQWIGLNQTISTPKSQVWMWSIRYPKPITIRIE